MRRDLRALTRAAHAPILVVASLLGGCRGADDASPPAPPSAGVAPPTPSASVAPKPEPALRVLAREQLDVARKATVALRSRLAGPEPETRASYLAFRRAVAAAAPLLSSRSAMASEVVVGPARSANEAGGSLATLDAAIEARDRAGAAREAEQIERALELAAAEIDRRGVPADVAALALSNAAFDLGALLLEAAPALPADPKSLLEDQRGALVAITAGSEALARDLGLSGEALAGVRAAAAPIQGALDRATSSLDLTGRGALALATGKLGAAIRKLAEKGGATTRLPYPARVPVDDNGPGEPVSILTIPAPRRATTSVAERRALAEVGRKLFTDKRLSRDGTRACSTCHDPRRYFTDGLVAQASLEPGEQKLRHTPTLLYAPLHAAQLWDGAKLAPEAQALRVIHSRAEMGLTPAELARVASEAPEYRDALAAPGKAPGERVADALAAFETEALVPADAPIDRLARGDADALDAESSRGLDVFAGKALCTRCHVPPLFGGSRPRDFAVPVFAAIGVPDKPNGHTLDPDRGRASVTRREADAHAFKTPTVRDVARTAPYFHNGRFARLEDVVDFYDAGGGRGLGLEVENQDPDVRKLELSAAEKRALLAFMRVALLDGSPPERAMIEKK